MNKLYWYVQFYAYWRGYLCVTTASEIGYFLDMLDCGEDD